MEPNTGSFGAAIGGSEQLKQAMARRGMGVGATQQTSPGSIAGAPPVAPPTDMAAASMATGMPQAPTEPQAPDNEVMIATKALATMVTNDSKMKKDMVSARSQGAI